MSRAIGWFGYYFARFVTWILTKVLWRMEVVGSHNIPSTGSFIMCPVHRSNLDGPIACTLTRRRMRFLSKEEVFATPTLTKLFLAMGAIPVNRGTPDRKSLHACLSAVEEGYPLVLFPEGGRRSGHEVAELMDGAAYIAFKAGVPVIPVGISGSEEAQPSGSKLLRPVKVRVVIGEPFSLPGTEDGRAARSAIREASALIHQKLQHSFDQALGKA